MKDTVGAELESLAIDLDHMGVNPTPVADENFNALIVLNGTIDKAFGWGKKQRWMRLQLLRRLTRHWPVLTAQSNGYLSSTKHLTWSAALTLIGWMVVPDSDPPELRAAAAKAMMAVHTGEAEMPPAGSTEHGIPDDTEV